MKTTLKHYQPLALGLSLMAFLPNSLIAKENVEKPNILFIFADDHCFDCLGSLHKDNIQTPNLDKLRASGTYFSHAFNQGSWHGAVSVCSRNMLTTGAYLWKVRTYNKENGDKEAKDGMKPNTVWPQYMKSAGYETYFTGKWHVQKNILNSFDHVDDAICKGMMKQSPDCYNRKFIDGQPDKWTSYDKSYGGFWDENGVHQSEKTGKVGVNFVNQAAKKDNPFFIYVAFNAPHDPRQAPKEYFDLYPDSEIAMPKNFIPTYPYATQIGCGKELRDERLSPFPRTVNSVKANRREYYAHITYLDVQIGKIFEALEKSGKADNTIIIYSADHGLSVGDHGFIGKQNMYDASMRVPLFISGPSIPKGKQIDDLVYLQDLVPTSMELAGSKHYDDMQFKSLMPLIKGEGKGLEAVYGAYQPDSQRSVRTENYQMIIYPRANVVRLYNIKKDPLAINDIASKKGSKKIMTKLYKTFKELQIETGDELNTDDVFNNFIQ